MIKLSNISKVVSQGGSEMTILDSIQLEIKKGEFVSIMGPSGSGKSSLLNIFGLLDTPTGGEYSFDGINVTHLGSGQLSAIRNQKMGFVFQSFMLIPRLTVEENVEVPLLYAGLSRKNRKDLVSKALEQVGMAERAKQSILNLSGGQKQKVAIARAIIQNPDVLLADEPTGNLDQRSKDEVMEIFSNLHRQGKTIILVTHDPQVGQMADRMLMLRDGKWDQQHSITMTKVGAQR